jgi:hypothetical protein
MPTAVANPAPSVTNKVVSLNGQSVTFTHKEWEMISELSLPATTITGLPAGQYQYRVQMGCTPSDLVSGTSTFTGTTAAGVTSVVIPACAALAYKDLPPASRAGTWYFSIEILVNNAGVYGPLYTTWTNNASSSVGFAAAGAPVTPLLTVGSTLHMVIPSNLGSTAFDRVIKRMADAGLKYVSYSMPWSLWAPTSAAIDNTHQALADGYFAALAANGMKAIVALHSVPATWAALSGVSGNPPANWTDFDTWLDYVIGRYGANIVAIGGINEPNVSNPTNPYYTGTTTQVYQTLVTEAQHIYNRVRASAYSASITTLGPALAFGDVNYLKGLFDNGLGAYIDGVNIHPYNVRFDTNEISDPRRPWKDHSTDVNTSTTGDSNGILGAVHKIHEFLNAQGMGTKPIWLCEYGWSHSMSGSGLDATARMQAEYIATSLKQLARVSYVQVACPYEWRDNVGTTNDPIGMQQSETPLGNWNNRFGYAENFRGSERRPGGSAVAGVIKNGFVGSSFIDYTRLGTLISGAGAKTWGNG